jgi:hypothetical protein
MEEADKGASESHLTTAEEEGQWAGTGKNERQILMPQRETKVDLFENKGECIGSRTCYRIRMTRLLRSPKTRSRRHPQKLWNGSMKGHGKASSRFNFEVPSKE